MVNVNMRTKSPLTAPWFSSTPETLTGSPVRPGKLRRSAFGPSSWICVGRHRIVGGEYSAVIVGAQPGGGRGGRGAADAGDDRGAGATDDADGVGDRDDRQQRGGGQLERGGARSLGIDLVDDAASGRLEAGPQIVDVVGVARQHDQVARRQQVEIGAAAQLN
jgi:hypothetical protein